MSLTGFVNPIYGNYAHAFDQRDGPRVERVETADRCVVFRWITPYKCENLGEIHFCSQHLDAPRDDNFEKIDVGADHVRDEGAGRPRRLRH
jgi:hypothetical protein